MEFTILNSNLLKALQKLNFKALWKVYFFSQMKIIFN